MGGFTVEREALLPALERVGKCVQARSEIPILSHYLIRVADGTISVSGTNLDQIATASVPAETEGQDSFCVPAALLLPSIKNASAADISLMLEGDLASVTAGRAKFRIPTRLADDFPADLMDREPTHTFRMAGDDLRRVAKSAGAFVGKDDRYYLHGPLFHVEDGKMHVVATNGHRLSLLDLPAPEASGGMPPVIVPPDMIKIMEALSGDVRLSLSESFIRADADGFAVASKLIDGSFPDYQRLLARAPDEKFATVDRKALIGAIKRVSLYSEGQYRDIAFSFASGRLTLEGWTRDGSATDEIEAECDFSLEIGFASQNIMACVESFDCDTLQFALGGDRTQTFIADPSDEARTVVVWPFALRRREAIAA